MIAHGNEETALLKDLINKWIPFSQLTDQSKNKLEIKDKGTLRDHDKRQGVTSGAVVISETPHKQHKPSTK